MPVKAGSFFRKYWPFTMSSFQEILAYKSAFFLYSLGGILRAFIMLFLWKAVFANNGGGVIAGFTMAEMVVYVFVSDFVGRVVYNGIDELIAWEVKEGTIAITLVRPISYQWRMFFNAVGNALTDFLFVGLPLWIGLVLVLHIKTGQNLPAASNLLLFAVSFGMSFVLMFFFNLCFGFLAFYTMNIWGLTHTKWVLVNFLSGRTIPLSFFPLWAQKAFAFLPFGSMTYSTVMIYLGKLRTGAALVSIGIQAVWIAVFAVLSVLIWRNAVRRLTIQGG